LKKSNTIAKIKGKELRNSYFQVQIFLSQSLKLSCKKFKFSKFKCQNLENDQNTLFDKNINGILKQSCVINKSLCYVDEETPV